MLRSLAGCSDERKVDIGCSCGRKLFFRFLSCFFQSLKRHLISGKVYTLCFLELVDHPLGNTVIEIIAAQMCIAVGCQNLDNAVTDLDDGNIECTAT